MFDNLIELSLADYLVYISSVPCIHFITSPLIPVLESDKRPSIWQFQPSWFLTQLGLNAKDILKISSVIKFWEIRQHV